MLENGLLGPPGSHFPAWNRKSIFEILWAGSSDPMILQPYDPSPPSHSIPPFHPRVPSLAQQRIIRSKSQEAIFEQFSAPAGKVTPKTAQEAVFDSFSPQETPGDRFRGHTYIQTDRQTDKHTCIHTYIQTYIHTYINTYIHTCSNVTK